ncbi:MULTISPECIES: NAD(P)/FAD-dependent oxidoreductase [Streptomyces]|uniref:NAD(P)/FAD-dependent oxidoreductase n=1 Tax=Streptomyces TaxID=1883 RepID=UPI0011620341|nr:MULTISPECIES: FAD-dependent oxidoreductase [unclassified Streptomyces]NMI56801.1 FAD-dependent oxidoreductase [Streptomyces sp. RLA2-12]QDN56190.1 NAD(P)/FAD-dependent oxidoreductase [Streptomyces sp. S1D4-20]QDN66367.1 NAD(P)/FAD-dependent oxidoreductase [Streptomyces sp. S1D4-14]QDO48775.1 NAD(P)/FAD-dependent oxidoreductase [Streptomyces sp. RLB3-5]QDO59015.1 NAD(P)/FAD-dependent oxidoreductase [Streptomyces sp. RLB1-8]
MRTVAVVGASLAGLSAARSLRKQGYDGRLVVIGDELHRPYDRPPLSKEFLAGTLGEADLSLETDDEDLRAEWLLGARAAGLDRAERAVRLADGREVRADGIVIATGAVARTLPGSEGLAGVHTLRTLDDARALRDELARGGRLVVIGGGFIGAEVASTAYALGLDVTVVEAAPTPLAGPLGATMGDVVSALHMDHGVRLLCGVGVKGLSGERRVDAVLLEDGRSIPGDIVVVGVGARPCVEWLEGSGVELDNGVKCGADGRTSLAGVVAVGDCANWYDPRAGAHRRVEHWTGARERPDAAIATLLAGGAVEPGVPRPPYFWSDQYGVKIQFAGHAAAADSVTIEAGAADDRDVLAVYRRAGVPVAVLGMNQPRLFTRWRKQLAATSS